MKNPLKQYANDLYSQNGEDGIIKRIFELLPQSQTRACVEFGAWDGKHLSNTYDLIYNQGWKGLLIEANKGKFEALTNNFIGKENAVLLNEFVNFEGENSLDRIFERSELSKNFDLISIDIDGNDYHIWDNLKVFRPKLVVIEFNPTIPSDVSFVQPKDMTVFQSSSLLALIELGKKKGYELIATTFCNAFFIDKEYYSLFDIEDNSIGNMWDLEEPCPRIYQLFDGTIMLTEEVPLYWRPPLKIGKDELQFLSKKERVYGAQPGTGIITRVINKIKRTFSN